MAAGTHYKLTPEKELQEFYRVDTGVRKSGPYKLDITNLAVGSTLPVFTPVEVDMKKHTVTVVRNVQVVEKYANGATSIKVAKRSLAYVGMFIGNSEKGAKVTAIDKSNANYDVLTIAVSFGADVAVGEKLFEAVALDGVEKKNTANFVLYDAKKVEDDGAVLVTLLMQAFEIKESKLILPIHDLDKKGLTDRFQFDY